MVCRHHIANTFSLLALLFAASVPATLAQDDDADCRLTVGSNKYDLTALKGDHSAARTRETPPSSWVDAVRFNVCGELAPLDGVGAGDQCASGTRACLTKTNKKEGEADRVVAVVPVAQVSETPAYAALSSPRRGLSITLHGASYPSSDASADPIPQSFVLDLLCDTEVLDPIFKSYDGSQVHVEWSAPAGCEFKGDDEPKQDEGSGGGKEGGGETDDDESVGSGIGWFFLALLLVFAGYFALGAYYNYTTYGATGADLIPHRDFWREVPYMLRDVLSHLCSSFRPRHTSSRGGYIAV
ncbi:hypothetical protein BV25DRAFT_1883291 [Artomyces pyxidatus]|uniref:Uncharacterized protein n=1 Tax=Artomyces pyxidatus TaxID=48021 RepID=A0ACB8T5I5_9AGAM|nr:hypothetical protein BV25DRAFT_1883291 [Artomyces pyxidatus]